MVKLHCDIIEDFNSQFVDDLVKLCRTNNILIIEDKNLVILVILLNINLQVAFIK